MMRVRSFVTGATAFGGLLLALPALAQAPVAVVEDVSSKSAGVEFMDYVPAGKVIRLGGKDTLVLGYMKSCWRETITGGVVTIGAEESAVTDGNVRREKVGCDGGKMQLTAQQASKSGAMVFRAPPKLAPTAQLTLYGQSPVIEVKGGGHLIIERIDEPGEKLEVNIADKQLMRGAFYDFAKDDKKLHPGGLYRASVGDNQIVFRVDAFAQPGQAPIVGRLLRFQPPS
jgi:hypothetical protein